MSVWQVKAAKDSIKAALPFQRHLRRAKRLVSPHQTNPDNNFHLLFDCLSQVATLERLAIEIGGKTIVEVGTGWIPLLPIIYRLYGADRIITVDQERLMDSVQIQDAVKFVHENIGNLVDQLHVRPPRDFECIPAPDLSPSDFLTRASIDYKAPFDFLGLPADTADVIVSRDVLEHIPEATLVKIANHSYEVLRPGGVICHTIDMSDHWEHGDKSISKVNFLQYDGVWWKLAGKNPQNHQNRLRRYEYLEIFRQAGFEIIEADGLPDPASSKNLTHMRLCDRYRSTPLEELAILSTTIVAQRPVT
jgi:SAM-dependent methyltransferase